MNVAFLIPSLVASGAGPIVARLARGLIAKGIGVIVFVAGDVEDADPPDADAAAAVAVVRLPALRAGAILAAVRDHAVDVLSDHHLPSLDHLMEMQEVARTCRVVVSEHGSYFYPLFQSAARGRRDALALYEQRAALYKGFAAVTSATRGGAGLLATISDRVVLMPDPVADDAAPTRGDPRRILAVASLLDPASRMDLLLTAFGLLIRKMPAPVLLIVGTVDVPRFQMLCREAHVPPTAVELTGFATAGPNVYTRSSVFAMTHEIETGPSVLLDAAAHGLPQVAYRLPGIEDQVIDGETGYVVDPGDAEAFADRLKTLLSDAELRRGMGTRAREHVQARHAGAMVASRWLTLLAGVVETGAPPADLVVRDGDGLKLSTLMAEAHRWLLRADRPGPTPKVSVVVPVFGTEELLGKCLDSLLHQTLREIEVIVVDDASPGNVKELIALYLERDPRLSFVSHDTNKGLYQARSTGARLARGAFLAHVDSDDYVHPDFLRRLYEAALTTGADIVECKAVEASVNGEIREYPSPRRRDMVQPELFAAFVDDEIKHVLWNKLYRRSFWTATPLHMEVDLQLNITEDLLRNTPLFLACRKYVLVDAVLYYYVRREVSVVTEGNFQRMLGKLADINAVYATITGYLAAQGQGSAVLAKLRQRQVDDLAWYIGHGYQTTDEGEAERLMSALRTHDIFAAVAVQQARELQELRAVERRYQALLAVPTSEAAAPIHPGHLAAPPVADHASPIDPD